MKVLKPRGKKNARLENRAQEYLDRSSSESVSSDEGAQQSALLESFQISAEELQEQIEGLKAKREYRSNKFKPNSAQANTHGKSGIKSSKAIKDSIGRPVARHSDKSTEPEAKKEHIDRLRSNSKLLSSEQNWADSECLLSDFGQDFEASEQSVNTLPRHKKKSSQKKHLDQKKSDNSKHANPKNEYKYLLHKGIHLLSIREHAVEELKNKLHAKSENHDVVLAVMDFLLENDYVSDVRFAESYVRAKVNKGQGPLKIRAELRVKGVQSDVIDEHVKDSSDIWFDIMAQLCSRKYGDEPILNYKEWSKRARFLQGRGFTMDHIHNFLSL